MNNCPSCAHPIDREETRRYVDGSSVTQCSNCGMVLSSDEETALPSKTSVPASKRIANFSLIRLLGRGGFGDVWLAEDRNLGRQVALKLPKTDGKDSKLLHEAQTAAKLRHPNIVSIYEVGLDDEQVFIASEYIDGEDLQSELTNGRPEIDRAARIVATIARAVQHAHEHGVVHRDLKPANIILNAKGEPFITDFGIAKHLSVDDTISTDGQVVGTVSYMSPEQARGSTRETDSRSDIYALGVMLFELLTEYRPFRGNARAVIHQKINEDPPSPRKLLPSLPRDVATICLKCLEREPAKRYSTAADVADELDRFRQSIPIRARPTSRGEKVWRWCRRKPLVAGLFASLLISLTTGLIGTSFFWMKAAVNADRARGSLYRAQMNLASRLWERGDIVGLRQTLDRYAPPSPDAGLRGFEWHYYNTLLVPFVQTTNFGDAVSDVSVSCDGQLFAATGSERVVRVWKRDSGALLRTINLPRRATAIAFSPVDNRLASASADGVVRIWNPQNHDRVLLEFAHGGGLTHTVFSSDGRTVVSAGRRGKTYLWNLRTQERVAEVTGVSADVTAIRFDGAGGLLAVAARDGSVHLWETSSGNIARRLSTNSLPLSLDFVDGGSTLAVGTYGSTVQFWSVTTGEKSSVARLDAAVGDLEFLADHGLLAAVTTRNELKLLDRQHRTRRALVTHSLTHGMLARSADDQSLLAGSGDGSLKLLSVASLLQQDIQWHESHVRDLAFSGGGKQLVICTGDGSVEVLDPSTGDRQRLVEASGREMLSVAVQPGGNLIACGGMASEVLVLDLELGELIAAIDLSYAGISALDFSRDGRKLACGSRNGSVSIYEVGQWDTPIVTDDHPGGRVTDVRFSPSVDLLAICYSSGHVSLRAETVPNRDSQIEVPSTPLTLEFCDNGDLLAVGTQTGEIHVFDARSQSQLRVVKAHSSRINALVAFPGGERLVSGGRDRELRIWDVRSGELVSRLPGHRRQVFGISVSENGDTLASSGLAGDVRLWRSRPLLPPAD